MSINIGAKWDGTLVNSKVLEEYKVKEFVYWNVSIRGCKYWVIRRYISDLRPVIADELKPYFGLRKNGTHYIKNGKRYILLIRARNPYKSPELTLNKYIKDPDIITDELIDKVRSVFIFRRMTGMTNNKNDSISVRKLGNEIIVFSIYDSFPVDKNKVETNIPESVINKWFESGNIEFHDCLSDMLGTPRSSLEDVNDIFGAKIESLSDHIEKIILKTDRNLVWYQSDIINYIIGKVTPR